MNALPLNHPAHDRLTAFFWRDDALRSRSVSGRLLAGNLAVPAPPARVRADWEREIRTRLCLEPGDVEQMPLPLWDKKIFTEIVELVDEAIKDKNNFEKLDNYIMDKFSLSSKEKKYIKEFNK